MNDDEIEERYAKLLKIKEHVDAIKDDWDEETLAELKEFLHEKYSNGDIQINAPLLINADSENVSSSSSEGFFGRVREAFERDIGIDPGRLMGLSDGIFGMVMTLLVFGIAIPELVDNSYGSFLSAFMSMLPTIGVTIVGFVIISSFWIYHHEYMKIKNLNIPYLWMNILFLICLSFIPFSTSLIGEYSEFFASEVVFGVNILLAIISFLLMYVYATKKGFMEVQPTKKERGHVLLTMGTIMGLTVIVNLLDFNVSSNFIYLFLLIPVISTIMDIWHNYRNS
ncbi:TMEM175 family protein [Methanobrevibacter sp.]|uniref:TMEM175 family protein n=1 Tax=Methanobrevibacter sp. TaxID=66852 RepID=UPI00388D8924